MRRASLLTAFNDKLVPDYIKNIELNLLLMPHMRMGGRGWHFIPGKAPGHTPVEVTRHSCIVFFWLSLLFDC